MEEQVNQIEQQALKAISSAADLHQLEDARVKYLGKKSEFTGLLRSLGSLSPEKRPVMGALINKTKQKLQHALVNRKTVLMNADQQQKIEAAKLDVSLPGKGVKLGRLHPLTQTMHEAKQIFIRLGYEVAEGPEIELDYYNFDGLNIPPHHASRDAFSTLFIDEHLLLRTHTSPVQVRVMEKRKPPLAIVAPGRVYRRDTPDASHSPVFQQLEGFLVDEGITFGDLKGTLTEFTQQMFGRDRKVRFRPSFFPFTEPSAEVDVSCMLCNGKGCRLCKGSGWIEILGSGMIDPNVFKAVGYDPEKYSGFAFGMGIERIHMLKFGVDNIRLYYEDDLRFLEQF
ncbi:MAG: phenylalanine--tRNA ligase subunit alpha [Candidatus Saganbacteria bacterium]|nr:phenylalanine--tRNA ligase subunit alpha [Candidatus Saganbacteria bacterium]